MAAPINDLHEALLENLDQKGLLTRLRSELYSEVLKTINADDSTPAPRPAPPDALLVLDLVREFLSYSGLRHSLEVFNLETGGPTSAGESDAAAVASRGATQLPRRVLADELGLKSDSSLRPVPLIYHLVATAKAARAAITAADVGKLSTQTVAPLTTYGGSRTSGGSHVAPDSQLTTDRGLRAAAAGLGLRDAHLGADASEAEDDGEDERRGAGDVRSVGRPHTTHEASRSSPAPHSGWSTVVSQGPVGGRPVHSHHHDDSAALSGVSRPTLFSTAAAAPPVVYFGGT